MQTFLQICAEVGVPISEEKTEWSLTRIVFLGVLLDGVWMFLAIPDENCRKAINLLCCIIDKKKCTVRELQSLCGYLNFLNKAIYPGRVFMRRMYAKYAHLCITEKNWQSRKEPKCQIQQNETDIKLKPHHHIKLDAEFKADCKVWLQFLTDINLSESVNRPMVDIDQFSSSQQIRFYTDASAAKNLGYGCILNKIGLLESGNLTLFKTLNQA